MAALRGRREDTRALDARGRRDRCRRGARRARPGRLLAAVVATSLLALADPSAAGASSGAQQVSVPGVTADSVTVAQLASLTGFNNTSSDGIDATIGAKVRIALQNARGGVDGRKIRLILADDGSSPTTALTAVKSAIETRNAFALLSTSGLLFPAAKFLQQNDIPVVGDADDGEEWCTKPYTNMFPISGDCDPGLPQYTTLVDFMKQHGVTTLATLGYGISPTSSASARGLAFAARKGGLKVGYLNDTVPFNGVNVTSDALQMKSAHVNGLYMAMAADTSLALVTAAKQAGVPLRVAVLPDGYGQSLFGDRSAVQAAQGSYFTTRQVPSEVNDPAVRAQRAAFKKYAHVSGVIGAGYTNGWLSADLFIKGLELAGRKLTRASFIAALRRLHDYTAGGLLPTPSNFSLRDFGHAPKRNCEYFVRLQGNRFVPVPANGRPVCGTLIPHSDQLSPS